MDHHPLPEAGSWVLVTLPQPYTAVDAPARYAVADVRDWQLTLRAEERFTEPGPPPGVPCVVRCILPDDRWSSWEAFVVASGASMLIVEVAAGHAEPPRYRRPCVVQIEIPDAGLGVVEGVLQGLGADGLQVHVPVLLEADQRVFVTVLLTDTQPLLAIAAVRDVHRWNGDDDLVARLEFTLMAPAHRARLGALLDWPTTDEGEAVVDLTRSGKGSTERHLTVLQ